jgi:hypothetical protein
MLPVADKLPVIDPTDMENTAMLLVPPTDNLILPLATGIDTLLVPLIILVPPITSIPVNNAPLPKKYCAVVTFPVADSDVKLPELGVTLPMGILLIAPWAFKAHPYPFQTQVLPPKV